MKIDRTCLAMRREEGGDKSGGTFGGGELSRMLSKMA